jgi:hypothetical protein
MYDKVMIHQLVQIGIKEPWVSSGIQTLTPDVNLVARTLGLWLSQKKTE